MYKSYQNNFYSSYQVNYNNNLLSWPSCEKCCKDTDYNGFCNNECLIILLKANPFKSFCQHTKSSNDRVISFKSDCLCKDWLLVLRKRILQENNQLIHNTVKPAFIPKVILTKVKELELSPQLEQTNLIHNSGSSINSDIIIRNDDNETNSLIVKENTQPLKTVDIIKVS